MSPSRDRRRFGPGPYILGLRQNRAHWGEGFPFEVPAVAAIERIEIGTPVTLLAGDNGTVPRPVLGGALEPVLAATKPCRGYHLRAESFFNGDGLAESEYDELEAVRFTRGFLEAPERFLRAVLGDD